MLNILMNFNKILNVPFVTNFLNRFVNKYTAHGSIIILLQLETLGILPNCVSQNLDGLSNKEILIWTGIALGIYLIFHTPKPKNKLEKLQYLVDVKKAELELEQIKCQLESHKGKKLNRNNLL